MIRTTAALSIALFPLTAVCADEKRFHDVAGETGQFKTLLTAIQAAGLEDTLASLKPVTIFAPTDEAFAKLPEGTLKALLSDKPKLRAVLKHHVVPGKKPAAKVVASKNLECLLGHKLRVATKDGVRVAGASVVQTDLDCDIGVIHAIDRVLLPPADVVDVAKKAGKFKTLLTAVEKAGLTDALRGKGPFTVFAPTDEAFAALPEGVLAALIADKKRLATVLTYHVVPGSYPAAKVMKKSRLKSLEGRPVTISAECCEVSGKSTVKVNGATVVKADVKAGNGVIHVIDRVILPPSFTIN